MCRQKEKLTITVTIASKKYLGINLTEGESTPENCKTLMKETEQTQINGKITSAHVCKEYS